MLESSQLDVLREICNIGSGNASSALAQMMNTKVDIGVPHCEIIPFSEMTKGYSSPEEIIVSTVVQTSGDMEGFVMMNMPVRAAVRISCFACRRNLLGCLVSQDLMRKSFRLPVLMSRNS